MYRLDLHTHSIISYDGGITIEQYRRFLADPENLLAITDHNEISFAQKLHKEFGERIIVGEEIMATEGEIIGLFLNQLIEPKLSLEETIKQIRSQGGLVYIPHPLERTRKGLPMEALERIKTSIDIMEVFNARAKEPWLAKKVEEFASLNSIAPASSSDAHSAGGFGTAFSQINELPTKNNLVSLLKVGLLQKKNASLGSRFAPLRNKIKKHLGL